MKGGGFKRLKWRLCQATIELLLTTRHYTGAVAAPHLTIRILKQKCPLLVPLAPYTGLHE